MDDERYKELNESGNGLTKEELDLGWHWCGEWDGMLVRPGMDEALVCSCNHPKIEEWKKSQEAMDILAKLDEDLGL